MEKGLKVNAKKSKVMMFEECETVCDVAIWGACFEQVQYFKYLGGVANESGTGVLILKVL